MLNMRPFSILPMVSMRYLVDRIWKRYRKQGEGTGLVEYPLPLIRRPPNKGQGGPINTSKLGLPLMLYLYKWDGGLSGISFLEKSRDNDLPVRLSDGDWINPFPVSLNKLTGCGANMSHSLGHQIDLPQDELVWS